MVNALPHEIKERLQIITPSQNYGQFFKLVVTYRAFKAHPDIRIARRMVDVAVIIFIATHGISEEIYSRRALYSSCAFCVKLFIGQLTQK